MFMPPYGGLNFPYKTNLNWIIEQIKNLQATTGSLEKAWEKFENEFSQNLNETVRENLLALIESGTLSIPGLTVVQTASDFTNVNAGDIIWLANDISANSDINLPSGVVFDGGGHTITLDGVHITVKSDSIVSNCNITSTDKTINLGAIYVDSAKNVKLTNLHVYNIQDMGIAVRNSTGVLIEKCSVKSTRSTTAGFWLFDDANANTDGITLSSCEASYNGIDGFLIDCDNIILENCIASYNGMLPPEGIKGACGVYVDQQGLSHYNIQIIGGWFHHNAETGITIQRSDRVNIIGAICELNDWSGIDLKSSQGNLVSNVVVDSCIVRANCQNPSGGGENGGIQLRGAQYCTITNNRCYDAEPDQTQIYGIACIPSDTSQNSINNIISGNNLNYNKTGGLYWGTGSTGMYENLNLGNVVKP